MGDKVALQGNMDPAALYASAAHVQAEARAVLADFGAGNGHVFNLGHGITPEVEPARVQALVDTVHQDSVPYHI